MINLIVKKYFVFFIFCIVHSEQIAIRPDNVFSVGSLAYKTLVIDVKTNSLYVGADENLFRLWLYNINDTNSSNLVNFYFKILFLKYARRVLRASEEEQNECIRMGNTKRECSNLVRLIFVKDNGQLIICSSSGMKPQVYFLDGIQLTDIEPPKTIIGICSPHESLNTTAVYVEYGNPEEIPSFYSGIRTGLSLENHLIYRPPLVFNNKEVYPALRTVYTDSKWLNEPQFVGSFSIQQYVYFFFREIAVEVENWSNVARNIVYSRVARICKSDLGGKNVLRSVWSSYLKARLNCSINTGTGIFYLDNIRILNLFIMFLFQNQFIKLKKIQGIQFFMPRLLRQIHFQFLQYVAILFDNGIFLEQPSATSLWIQTPPDRVPNNRPGTCSQDSRINLSDDELHFSKSHLLMADSVASNGPPIYYIEKKVFTKIVVDQKDEHRVILFVLAPE